ncbi:transporter substrate-binding domain-containing protein [Pseudoclavibacter soli]|uniref:transporter substrate-binding domain-containing protein n=1 Tax=Pseudoclavibacter soli TaxID=452623 RepID=UPI000688D77C|nr:transporter substrate-binding domain-containing protein [Pseudoclavibacter soli]
MTPKSPVARPRHRTSRILFATAIAAAVSVAASGCALGSSSDSDATSVASSILSLDQSLHDALPDSVKESGTLKVVMPGANPPWYLKDGDSYQGVAPDLLNALGTVLGVKVEYTPMNDLAGAFAAVSAGRYDVGFSPYGDTGKSEKVDVVDVNKEIVPFLVPSGNPKSINSIDDVCGASIAALGPAGAGSAYQVLVDQSDKCTQEGKEAVNIVPLKAIADGALAVKSNRADAFFGSGAALQYYAKTSDDSLEVAGTEAANGFDGLYQGMIVPKGSSLGDTLVQAFQQVFDAGVYGQIFDEAGLDKQKLEAPGLNLARKDG